MNPKAFIGIAVIAVGAILSVMWFWSSRPPTHKTSGPLEKVTVGAETSLLTAAIWLAESKGYFESEGLDVTIKEFDSGKASFQAMLDGVGIDISTVAPTPIMFSSFKRDDFAIFATFVYSYDDVKVIARKDKGIATAKDLKGKKVGTPAGTTGQFFLNAFLTDNGILASDVEELDFSPSDLPGALEKNQVDAIVIWEPHGYLARRRLGGNAARLPSSEVYKETFNYVVMKEYAARHPEILAKFLRATDTATAFITEKTAEAQDIVARRLMLDSNTTVALWDDFRFEMSLDQALIRTLEQEGIWAIRNGLVDEPKIPNYLEYIHLESLKTINPKAVTIQK
jgi:NitT/TauT family transport system substrate-binding protein